MELPVTGIRVVINDGASHSVDSSEMAFQAAARGAFRQGYAKAKPGGYEPGPFARKVLRLERRFAEEMVTRRALENRKREVLNVAMDGQYYFDSGDEADREAAMGEKRHATIVLADATPVAKQPSSIRTGDDLGSELERRRQIARRNLDDFSAGNIPADMLRPRSSRWSRR